jgi:transposase
LSRFEALLSCRYANAANTLASIPATAKKLAYYCGVAPFKHQSGSSIKGKTKVSPLANKKMKALLNMAALSAKKYDVEIKEYYQRKVAEGKNKMSVLNAIRCKIIGRAFAVISRNSPFVNIQKFKTAS